MHGIIPAEFHKAYPEAKLIAVENVVNKKTKEGLKFAGCESLDCQACLIDAHVPVAAVWADNAREPTFGFEDDVSHAHDACVISE